MTGTKLSLAAMTLAAMFAVGCEDNDDKYSTRRDRDGDGITDRYDPRPDRDTVRDDAVLSRDRVGSRRGLDEIPRDAQRVDTAEGSNIRYEASRDGRVYLYDEDDDRVVYSGSVDRGELFLAEPDDDEISLNGKKLGDVNLRANHKYRLYFLRD